MYIYTYIYVYVYTYIYMFAYLLSALLKKLACHHRPRWRCRDPTHVCAVSGRFLEPPHGETWPPTGQPQGNIMPCIGPCLIRILANIQYPLILVASLYGLVTPITVYG